MPGQGTVDRGPVEAVDPAPIQQLGQLFNGLAQNPAHRAVGRRVQQERGELGHAHGGGPQRVLLAQGQEGPGATAVFGGRGARPAAAPWIPAPGRGASIA
jgi:hypothetical protein